MRALKKFRGPKEGTFPVTRAMLFALCKELNWETDMDDLVKYAAALVAFHFMLRSAEYCTRLTGGRFDLDRIIGLMDLKFFLKGVEIFTHFECADEVEVTLGKQKCSAGGERRRHSASLSCPDLCVVRILALLITRKGRSAQHLPLFTWLRGSTHPGDGVKYHDMRKLAQRAAELCGRSGHQGLCHPQLAQRWGIGLHSGRVLTTVHPAAWTMGPALITEALRGACGGTDDQGSAREGADGDRRGEDRQQAGA